MHVLQEHKRLSVNEISNIVDKETTDLHGYLRQFKQTALIRNQHGPRSGTNKPYYTLTSLGEVVLVEGLADGVEKLAAQKRDIQDRYSG